jgi:hypothetical protein
MRALATAAHARITRRWRHARIAAHNATRALARAGGKTGGIENIRRRNQAINGIEAK